MDKTLEAFLIWVMSPLGEFIFLMSMFAIPSAFFGCVIAYAELREWWNK
jgi:hypothetical protein